MGGMMAELVLSRAHEVAQALPLSAERYVCIRCGKRGPLVRLFSAEPAERCLPHLETKASGWVA